jgi:hypothetical protein
LQDVGQHDRHPVAFDQAELAAQVAGEGAAQCVDVGVAEGLAEIMEGRVFAIARKSLFHDRGERGVAIDIDLGGDAGRVMGQPRSLVAHGLDP